MKPHTFIEDKAWPESLQNKEVIEILKEYMNLSNSSNPAHPEEPAEEAFANLFTDDGVYELASKKASGHKEIVAMRKALFAHIPHRHHRILRYYTFDEENMHLLGLGTVDYQHHHGHETGSDWAAKYDLVKVGDKIKFKHVQIIVDTAHHN